jgi:hypothetical protein
MFFMKTTDCARLLGMIMASLLCFEAARGAVLNLSGEYTDGYEYEATEDTTVNLNGVVFQDCGLKLRGDKTFTINLVEGTQNVFTMYNENKELIKATKKSNIVFTGSGPLELTSTKRITDQDARSGVLVCNNLTVEGGDIKVTFDQNKSDTSCILVKGNYLQTGGKVKVDMKKKNCTNEFSGVHLEGSSFQLLGGKFSAEIAGTKSRAINLKSAAAATFRDCDVSAEFEGPQGRFVNGGKLVFESGTYNFTTNITEKMTPAYYPTAISAVKADSSITVKGGDFEADLPLADSEVFTTDSDTGTFVEIHGGEFDLLAGNDCIHANGYIKIFGGRIFGVSVFDDVIDANSSMVISGGSVRAWSTAAGAHGLDVNKGSSLTISGGTVVATDGVDAIKLGDTASGQVGKVVFTQSTYYGTLPTDGYSAKYLALEGATNGVPFVVKPRLPSFPAGRDFNLLVSVPGRTASAPTPLTVAQAYADADSRTPIVFEKKATVSGNAITTREGDVLDVPAHYDITPSAGRSKTFALGLNDLAIPEYADLEVDGMAAISVEGDEVYVGVRTLAGLSYRLFAANGLSADAEWTEVGGPVSGTGSAERLQCARTADHAFYKVRASD